MERRVVKDDLIKAVAKELGITQKEAALTINTFHRLIRMTLLSGKGVIVHGIGEFYLKDQASRIVEQQFGKQTDPCFVMPTKMIKFTVSKSLQNQIKKKFRTNGIEVMEEIESKEKKLEEVLS